MKLAAAMGIGYSSKAGQEVGQAEKEEQLKLAYHFECKTWKASLLSHLQGSAAIISAAHHSWQ